MGFVELWGVRHVIGFDSKHKVEPVAADPTPLLCQCEVQVSNGSFSKRISAKISPGGTCLYVGESLSTQNQRGGVGMGYRLSQDRSIDNVGPFAGAPVHVAESRRIGTYVQCERGTGLQEAGA